MTKYWVTDVILHPELLHHSYLIIPLKSKEFGVPMIRCLLTLLGLLALGSSYVVHNLRFSNNKDLLLSSLYEAKGFDPHLLRDVRRRLGTKSACGLVAWLLIGCAWDCL